MKLICERLESNLTQAHLAEEADDSGKKKLYIEGVFLQSGIKNRNGRIYPPEIMKREVDRYVKEYVNKNRALGELNHPPSPSVNPERACILIKELRQDGNNWIGKAQVTSSPMGQVVRSLIEDGVGFAVSSRGLGSLREINGAMMVQDDFRLATAADVVHDPSAPDAFVNGIFESTEWVWDNGVIKPQQIEEYKACINKAAKDKKSIEEAAIKAFQDFLSKL